MWTFGGSSLADFHLAMMVNVYVGVDIGGSHIGIGFLGSPGSSDVELLIPALSIDIDSSTITQSDITNIIKSNIEQMEKSHPLWNVRCVGRYETSEMLA